MALFDSLFKRGTPGRYISNSPWDTPLPNQSPDQAPNPQQQQSGGGTFFDTGKPHGKDWLGLALGAIGDAFAQQSGGQAMIAPLAMRSIIGARQARTEAQQRQATVQALVAHGLSQQDAEILSRDREATSKALAPAQPTELMQNFSTYNKMPSDQQQAFGSYEDMINPRYTNTPAGTQFIPRTAPGGLPSGYDPNEWEVVPGPDASQPAQGGPTIQNTPAPQLGGNGLPGALTPQQYQAIVAAKGQAATDAWLAQHPEIRVGGQ